MNRALVVIALAFVWAMITGGFTLLNLALGALIGLIAVFPLRDRMRTPVYLRKVFRILALIRLFIRELLLSAIRVAILVLTPNLKAHLRPAIIAFPLTAKTDAEITLLANLITLTPGTLSVDVSDDRTKLYVHVISLKDREKLIASIAAGFEARIMEVFR
jgi:multicomponent Na+:H+ antiporter subunit E